MNDLSTITGPQAGGAAADDVRPQHIGRYRVEKLLGQGGFGIVYLAHDDRLQRPVAIKVPHPSLVARREDAEAYLAEARNAAKLDHPHVVPVFDFDGADRFPCFIVSKYIDGASLAQRLKQSRPTLQQTIELTATVADTLHHAHKQGLVHRDVKPGNILLDKAGQPFVTDFGLALREQDVGRGPRYAGTPDYMSPEQARGEGHRVDGRSDVFSLGVVLYEMLAGRRPFVAESRQRLLEEIVGQEARPPRQWNDAIPKEVERICLKALSKRAADRYSTAKDFAEELRLFLAAAPEAEKSTLTGRRSETEIDTPPLHAPLTPPASGPSAAARVKPKGLRSFDAGDADFFLDLLPGPRGRDGLPDSVRFWKDHAENLDPESTFSVGLLYGPSGCGKSSLVKAGLLPRLAPERVVAVFLEATPEQTESRLLKELRRKCRDLPCDLNLKDSLAALRQGRGVAEGKKVLIVLDQFEQWLHAKGAQQNTELVEALRQCDGGRVQCIVMVRDDFWMAATRFSQGLDIPFRERENSYPIDLFPPAHAKKVLTAFGRAYGTLAEADPLADDADVRALLARLAPLGDELAPLRTAVDEAIDYAGEKPGWALLSVRSVLECMLRDVFERRISAKKPGGAPPPLENVLQQLAKAGFFPAHLAANADYIKEKGNRGAHDLGPFTAADVRQSLAQLPPILDWYFSTERPEVLASIQRGSDGTSVPRPRRPRQRLSDAQEQFIDQAVASLTQDGMVICVRLALFADMLKDEPWTPESLQRVGGAEGVGFAFLEKQFGASAPPPHRPHLKAVIPTLRALLPPPGTDIKGHMRSRAELLQASGYAEQPERFGGLLSVLDAELRLITPADAEAAAEAENAAQQPSSRAESPSGPQYYQLTHDFLVPSLRKWIAHKLGETRRGRAELLLADRAAIWNARPENRQLPSLWQSLTIRLLTKKNDWTPPQRRMMRRAGRVHGLHSAIAALLLVALAVGGREIFGRIEAHSLVDQLDAADIGEVPKIVDKLAGYRHWAVPLLKQEDAQAERSSKQKLHLALALLPVDESKVDYLRDQLLAVTPSQFPVVRDALLPHEQAIIEPLWGVALDPKRETHGRFRAACALATYAPDDKRWAKVQDQVADDLVAVPAVYLATWMDALRPVRGKLLAPLGAVFRDAKRKETERALATDILADYAAGDATVLAGLTMDADSSQFKVIYPKLAALRDAALPPLLGVVRQNLSPDPTDPANELLAKRQANAAVVLLRLGQSDAVWPLLKHPARPEPAAFGFSDPRVRSYLIDRIAPLGADPALLIQRLDVEADLSTRRALLLSLGEFNESTLPPDARGPLLPKLQEMYRTDPDPGLHAAAEWLLRKWKQDAWLKQQVADWAGDKDGRAKRLAEIQRTLPAADAPAAPPGSPRWFVNSQGQTLIFIPGPAKFLMGSPKHEAGRSDDETQHEATTGRPFAITATLVTREQFGAYFRDRGFANAYNLSHGQYNKYPDQPAVAVNWFMAADYCNWLSANEGLDPCYEISGLEFHDNFQHAKVTMKPNFMSLGGYRLPTEAEMEYAIRAGADTSRYFGETDELLPNYAWYLLDSKDDTGDNNTHPVGRLKPNDLGLFDTHGNAWAWCQEEYSGRYAPDEALTVDPGHSRVLRGGTFSGQPSVVRSAYRDSGVPTNRGNGSGFRAARTLPPAPFTTLPPTGR